MRVVATRVVAAVIRFHLVRLYETRLPLIMPGNQQFARHHACETAAAYCAPSLPPLVASPEDTLVFMPICSPCSLYLEPSSFTING